MGVGVLGGDGGRMIYQGAPVSDLFHDILCAPETFIYIQG